MKKIILAIMVFGTILYAFASDIKKIGTGLEWEAHNIRIIVVGKGNKFIDLEELYGIKLFEAEINIKNTHVGKGYIHDYT
ncbi:MAG: hypothetical protein GY754_10375 [bacterium]|nr:hypothetical protein [bacterium]